MQVKNHTYQQLSLKDDYEGKVEATLISADSNTNKRPSVLYLHGFIDYFFHPHLSEFFNQNGYDFYALELRKYGHSMLPHQHPNYVKDVAEYFEELDASVLKIKEANSSKLVMLGHSTGGLIMGLYLNKGTQRDLVSALVLNSPFVETNVPTVLKAILKPLASVMGSLFEYSKLDGMLAPIYPSSVHKDYEGEWEFNLEMKPIKGFPVYFNWSRAIMKAQNEIQTQSDIKQPIVLLHSHQSYLPKKHEPRVFKADIVLNVEHMKMHGPNLGKDVTMIEIKDGMHDLFLSPKPVREHALNEMMKWLKERV